MDQKTSPVFIKLDEYKEIVEILRLAKNKISEAQDVLHKINELKSVEDAEIEQWQASIEDVARKIRIIDNTLFDPEQL